MTRLTHASMRNVPFASQGRANPRLRNPTKSLLRLIAVPAHYLSHLTAIAGKQGLYLPSFESRQMKINGKCVAIARAFSQTLFL